MFLYLSRSSCELDLLKVTDCTCIVRLLNRARVPIIDFSYTRVGARVVKMAASCCGVKKQKLNNSMPASCNGGPSHLNGYKNGYTVASRQMCFYCFDVLHGHLHSYEPPKPPSFTNEC